MSLTKIGSIGINTGIAFAGVTTIVTLNTANDALSIGATVNVGSGITLGASGDIFATGVTTSTTFSGAFSGSGANITALNASNISSGTVPTARLGSGTASSSTFLRGDSSFQTVDTNLVADTSPQLGGNLDGNDKNILLNDSSGSSNNRIRLGASQDFAMFHNGTINILEAVSGNLHLRLGSSEEGIIVKQNDAVELYYNNALQVKTTSTGLSLGDSKRIDFGAGSDLQIFHDGTNSNLYNQTNSLYIRSADVRITNAGVTEHMAKFFENGAVELYHNNLKKFSTDSNGAQIHASEGSGAVLILTSDEGDDNADNWRLHANPNHSFYLQNYTSGSYETNIQATGDGAVYLYHDNSERLATHADGIVVTNYVKFTGTSCGIDFGSTSNAGGMTSEVLDDYEEGTWTPTLASGTSTLYLTQWYVKIGTLVTCYFYSYQHSDSSSSTHYRLGGLPFAHATNKESSFHVSVNGNASLGSGSTGVWGRIGVTGSTTQITFYRGFASSSASLTHADIGSAHFLATFSYHTV